MPQREVTQGQLPPNFYTTTSCSQGARGHHRPSKARALLHGHCRLSGAAGHCPLSRTTAHCRLLGATGHCPLSGANRHCRLSHTTAHCRLLGATGHCPLSGANSHCRLSHTTAHCRLLGATGHCRLLGATGHCPLSGANSHCWLSHTVASQSPKLCCPGLGVHRRHWSLPALCCPPSFTGATAFCRFSGTKAHCCLILADPRTLPSTISPELSGEDQKIHWHRTGKYTCKHCGEPMAHSADLYISKIKSNMVMIVTYRAHVLNKVGNDCA